MIRHSGRQVIITAVSPDYEQTGEIQVQDPCYWETRQWTTRNKLRDNSNGQEVTEEIQALKMPTKTQTASSNTSTSPPASHPKYKRPKKPQILTA